MEVYSWTCWSFRSALEAHATDCVCAAVVFNLINAAIFNIGIFPWFMLGATLIFFPPDLMRRFARAFLTPGAALRDDTKPERLSTSDPAT